jgi:glycosyltransferase involved in cell wall biosynthesis
MENGNNRLRQEISIDLVITLYNAETYLDEYLMECKNFCDWLSEEAQFSVNIFFVDDGSSDRTLEVLKEWYKSNQISAFTNVLVLSRNFGQHNAILAGLEESNSHYVILLDGDLDQSPNFARKFIEMSFFEGIHSDVVYAYREKQFKNFKNFTSMFFWKLLSKELKQNLEVGQLSMRMMSRNYVEEILKYKGSSDIFWGAIFHLSGFKQIGIKYESRTETPTNYNFKKRMKLARNVLLNYTTFPYRIIFKFLSTLIFVSAIFLIYQFKNLDLIQQSSPGWSSLFLISFLSLIMSTSTMAILIYQILETKKSTFKSPKYHIANRISL